MERRAFLANSFTVMPFPSPDNCQWCGFDSRKGEHGIIGPSEIEGKVSVKCKVPFDLPSQGAPRLDVLEGVGYFRGNGENDG